MSVAEKLKALETAIPLAEKTGAIGPTGVGPEAQAMMSAIAAADAQDALRRALPEIIAVVEADETGWKGEGAQHCEHCGAPTLETRTAILYALSALDEALT